MPKQQSGTTAIQRAKAIVERTRLEISSPFLEVSGRALYSPIDSLASGSRYYFLGINPGESPQGAESHDGLTVAHDLGRLEAGAVKQHGYIDEIWKGYSAGHAPMQKRGQLLFQILAGGLPVDGMKLFRQTPTSNLILARSKDVLALRDKTGLDESRLAEVYWPFHHALMKNCGCNVVITHALTAARGLAKAFKWKLLGERDSGWGGTLGTCCIWELSEDTILFALPNFSRYSPDGARLRSVRAILDEYKLWP